MQLYWKNVPEEIHWFEELMRLHHDVAFFQPSPKAAPWHVQGRLPNGVLINFWPHKVKAMIEGTNDVLRSCPDIQDLIWAAKGIPSAGETHHDPIITKSGPDTGPGIPF